MKKTPLHISCHTPDILYTDAAMRLRDSLECFGLEYEIQVYEPLGSWIDNTFYKPFFIRAMLKKHPGRPLVFLDADAEVVAYPELLHNITADLAAGYFKGQLLSGTLYLENNERVRGLLKLWMAELAQEPNPDRPVILSREQVALQKAAEFLVREGLLTFERLPFSYVCIFDAPREEEPVILHHQLSRQGRELYGT